MTEPNWMMRALELARRGRGHVEPNPMVGAVVVRDGAAVGEGWHQRFGQAHAEVHALSQAGDKAKGATLYVTLEPCSHTGKTPPCVEAILRAGIRRVVAAMVDPFPDVAGRGIAQLRDAGVEVVVGVGEAQSRRLNAPYLTLIAKSRPYVHAKWAMTLDGKIATHAGRSKWISSEESRRRGHELRGTMDAIIVGAGTVRADDPMLTARPAGPRTALRIVLSTEGHLPKDCKLVQTAREFPVAIAGPRIKHPGQFESLGCEVLAVDSISTLLTELARRGFTNVMVEGGSGVLGSFNDEDLIDEVHVFLAPSVFGGRGALSPVGGLGAEMIDGGLTLNECVVDRCGEDVYINGRTAVQNLEER
jgi:diaminohydroxyphosphoribosylaminopyrimidine deaminase/5-amino-6-(5-phosphoribosylamino)uracil reductase